MQIIRSLICSETKTKTQICILDKNFVTLSEDYYRNKYTRNAGKSTVS